MITTTKAEQVSFSEFLSSFRKILKSVFYERDNLEKFIQKRGFPALVLRDIMAANPLSVSIPKEYGGRGTDVKECLGLLEAASYESLPLSLTFGINIALFDIDVAEIINCGLYQVDKIDMAFSQQDNPYFIRKDFDDRK